MPDRLCDYCGKPFIPRQYNQRYCDRACSIAWQGDERRIALERLRSTYFGRAMMDSSDPAKPIVTASGRDTGIAAPNWSRDPTGPEPPLGIDIEAVPDLRRVGE